MRKKWSKTVQNRNFKKQNKVRIQAVLASESPRRKEMLQALGIPFREYHPSLSEPLDLAMSSSRLAAELASRKALACQKAIGFNSDHLIIAMDTLVVQGNTRLGKPNDATDAFSMLTRLSGKSHTVITGVALIYKGRLITETARTKVFFKQLNAGEIEWYISTGEPFDKAGAYAIQGMARLFVTKIEGCYFNVLGFPITAFQRGLKRCNLSIFDLMKLD